MCHLAACRLAILRATWAECIDGETSPEITAVARTARYSRPRRYDRFRTRSQVTRSGSSGEIDSAASSTSMRRPRDRTVDFGTHTPEGYLIVDDNKRLRTLPFAAQVTVQVIDLDAPGGVDMDKRITLAKLPAHLAGERQAPLPYWLTVSGGQVTALREEYLA